jgi:hypothetical protein
MQQSPFFIIVAIVNILFGLAFVIIPDQLASWYGIATVDDVTRLMGRYFGSATIGIAIIYVMARDLGASPALTGLLWAGLVSNVIELVLAFLATTGGVVGTLGWANVVISILLSAGFAYLLFAKPAQA